MSEFEIDIAADTSKDAFQFVQALAAELSLGAVDIPGFPSIVTRVRQVLADESASAEKVARVVGADPVLAARLLNLANSVALLGTARPATDLRTAVSRVGLNTVRSTTHAHAVRVLGQCEALRGLEKPLEMLARQTGQGASLCHAVALLENWNVPDEIVHSVSESEDLARDPRGAPSLTDVLMLALAIARHAA